MVPLMSSHSPYCRGSAASDSTSAAPSCKLSITAFAGDLCPLARTNDHAKAVLTHRDTPGHPAKATRNAQVTAVEVKEQAKSLLIKASAGARTRYQISGSGSLLGLANHS